MQSKDIPDVWFLSAVDALSRAPMGLVWPAGAFGAKKWGENFRFELTDGTRWVMRWEIERLYKLPEKLVLSKARKLIRRELLDGCDCGCRGDFELTDAGKAMIARV